MPPIMSGMTDEVRKQDEAQFAEALNNYNASAKVSLLNNTKNHEFARVKAAQTYTYLEPHNAFSADVYASVFVRCNSEMEREAPPAPKVIKRDDSGDARNNPRSTSFGGNILAAQELVGRQETIEKELWELRAEERLGLLTPEKAARVVELMAQRDAHGVAPIVKTPAGPLEKLPIDAEGSVLKNASPAQLKDLLKRRREENWVAAE